LKNGLWIFKPTGKIARFLLVAEMESIACLHLAEVYPLWGAQAWQNG
jgi:hypothetical protein